MKKIILLFMVSTLIGCEKKTYKANEPTYGRSSFPTSISLGNDTSYFRVDSCTLWDAWAYLATCGTAPDTEAPNMGTEVYQISGASQAVITGQSPRVHISNLTFGTYQFVGHAFITGYRTCDSTYMNDNAYDTIQINIRKNKKRIK